MLKKLTALASSTFLATALDMLGTMILARALLPEGVGQVAIIVSMGLMYVAVANLGLGQAYIYQMNSLDRRESSLVHNSIFTIFISVIFAVLILYVLLSLFPDYFGSYSTQLKLVVSFGIAGTLSQSFLKPILVAKLQVKPIAILTILLSTLSVCSFGILYFLYPQVLTVELTLYIQSAAKIIVTIIMFYVVTKTHLSSINFSFTLLKESMLEGSKFYFSLLMAQANIHVSLLLLQSYLTDFTQSGFYARASSLTLFMTIIPFAIGPLFYARWAKVERAQAGSEVSAILKLFLLVLLIVCPFLIYFSEFLIGLVYGEAFKPAAYVFQILVYGIGFKILADPLINYLASLGKVHLNGIVSLLGIVVIVVSSVYFIPLYQGEGAAISFSLSAATILVLLLGVAISQGFKIKEFLLFSHTEMDIIKRVLRR